VTERCTRGRPGCARLYLALVRRVLPATLTAVAVLSAPASAEAMTAAEPAATGFQAWKPDVAAARAYALARSGNVAFSVRAAHRRGGLRPQLRFLSASVVKAMLLVAYLRRPAVRARALTPADRNLLTPMIRWSSNMDATRVFETLGPLALPGLARRAGMRDFAGGSFWSASRITARDQSRLFLRIDRLLPRRHRAYAMGLLERVVPWQRWGVARVVPRGWTLYFKGGWTRTLNHQAALLVRGRRRVAVAVLTRGSPDHAYATATLEGVFRRLLRGLAP